MGYTGSRYQEAHAEGCRLPTLPLHLPLVRPLARPHLLLEWADRAHLQKEHHLQDQPRQR